MNTSRYQHQVRRKRRIERRLRPRQWSAQPRPMYTARNIQYDHSDRVRGLDSGGIGAMHLLARATGLVDALDHHVQVLKVHLPFYESDHVLAQALNLSMGGECLEDQAALQHDEGVKRMLGACRFPDPTTAGTSCAASTSGGRADRGGAQPDRRPVQQCRRPVRSRSSTRCRPTPGAA